MNSLVECTLSELPLIIICLDHEGRITFVNQVFVDKLGYLPSEVVGQKIHKFIYIGDSELREANFTHFMSKERSEQKRETLIAKSGKKIEVLLNTKSFFDENGELEKCIASCISINNRVEKGIERSRLQHWLEVGIKDSRVGIWEADLKEEKYFWGDQLISIYELDKTSSNYRAKNWMNFIHPDDFCRVNKVYREALNSKNEFIYDGRIMTPTGKVKNLLVSANIIRDKKKQAIRVVGMTIDITKEKKAEEEARANNYRLQMAVHLSRAGVWDWDALSNDLFWDDRMYEIYNYPKKLSGDLTFQSWGDLIHPEDYKMCDTAFYRAIRKQMTNLDLDFRIITLKGELRHIRSFAHLFYNSKGEVIRVMGMNTDCTQERLTQLALNHAQKFAALGEMAGEVAHEINNPLTIIDGYTDRLSYKLEKSGVMTSDLNEDLNRIKFTVRRIANIVSGMRNYSRDSTKDEFVLTPVAEIIKETLYFTKEKLEGSDVSIHTTIDEGCLVSCRPTEISRALLNLINNSFDAIKNLKDKWIHLHVFSSGSRVYIEVTDSGLGIPEEMHQKILARFYTTKPMGEGTGMGLSISRDIARLHGGDLELIPDSKNTTFLITLPEVLL